MSPIILQTERLLLRPFEANDGPAFHEYWSDPEVIRYTASLPMSEEQAHQIIESIVASRAEAPSGAPLYAFAITLRTDGQLIGNCRFAGDKENPGHADIAYFLNRRFWRQGYATEAVGALIAYGFETLKLRRITALCVPENIRSRRVMEKVGMQPQEPIARYAAQGNFHQGAFQDITYLRYAIASPE